MPRLSMRQCRSQDLALDAEVEHLTDHGQQTIGLHRRDLGLVIQLRHDLLARDITDLGTPEMRHNSVRSMRSSLRHDFLFLSPILGS